MTAGPARFGIVGSGWRTQFYLRMAALMPDRFAVAGVVTRSAERGAEDPSFPSIIASGRKPEVPTPLM